MYHSVTNIRIFKYIRIFSAKNIRLYHIRIKISYSSHYGSVTNIRIFEYIRIFSATNIRSYHIRIKISYSSHYDRKENSDWCFILEDGFGRNHTIRLFSILLLVTGSVSDKSAMLQSATQLGTNVFSQTMEGSLVSNVIVRLFKKIFVAL